MAISKITLNGVTQMDVTQKTVTSGSMLNGITSLKNDGTDITGNIASKSSSDLTASGATVTAPAGYYESAASKTIPNATYWIDVWDDGFWTDGGVRKWKLKPFAEVDVGEGDTPGYFGEGRHYGDDKNWTAVPANTTITPSTSAQTVGGTKYMMEGPVTVAAMPSGTAGTPTATKGTVSNHSVTVTPSVTNTTGYITGGTKTGTGVSVSASELVSGTLAINSSGTKDVTNYASAEVAAGSATTPATTITANPSISVSSGGLITATVSATKNVTPTVSAGFVSSGTSGIVTASGSNTSQLSTQAAQTIYPSTSDQTLTSGIYLTGAQTIKAVKITNLSAENIAAGVTVEIGDADDSDRIISVTGTMPNPLEITQYVTPANVFNSPHTQVTNYATVQLTKNNQVCTLYLYMQSARWTSMGSGTVLGTLKDDFVPAGKSGTTAYIIVPLLGSSSPYVPCGSVWIYTQGTNRGKVISYFDTSASPGYFFASYIAGAQT